jgi:two-component system nitrate/nitrite response regulator NarL
MAAGSCSADADAPTVVLIEDHVLFRAGLRDLLERAGVRVLGEAQTAESGLDLVRRLSPDVAVVDLRLPRMSGHDAIRHIRDTEPATRALALTVSADGTDVVRAVLAGASGYLLKDAPPADIVRGVRVAAAGQSALSPRIGAAILDELRRSATHTVPANGSSLSAREQEVLRLVVDGKNNAAIARELVISPYTVRRHLSNILVKLRVTTRLQAAVRAVRDSLV